MTTFDGGVSERDRGTLAGLLTKYGPEMTGAVVRELWAEDVMLCRETCAFPMLTPRVESRVEIAYVRGGQPRAYADHERVHRVTFRTVDYTTRVERPDTVGLIPGSVGGGIDPEVHPDAVAEHDANLIIRAKQILGVDDLRVGHGSPAEQTQSEWFGPFLDYARVVEPGVVEVRVVTPYID